MSWVECLRKMRTELNRMGYDQVPELTSSRLIDVNKTMYIVPPGSTGRRRAILIGINYVGQQGQVCVFPICFCLCVVDLQVLLLVTVVSFFHTTNNTKYYLRDRTCLCVLLSSQSPCSFPVVTMMWGILSNT
jgi:hypothetical protein